MISPPLFLCLQFVFPIFCLHILLRTLVRKPAV